MLYNFAYYWVDLFRFAQLPAERAVQLLDRRVGDQHLFAAIEAGKGAILLTAHLGNWEMGGVLLKPLGVDLSVVYVPDQFADVEAFRARLRRATGVTGIAIHPRESLASLPVLRALRENRLVALQGDRDFNDKGVAMDFFGAPVSFPIGPFHLALATGAPLLPCFVGYSTGHRFIIEVGEPIRLESTGDRRADVERGLRQWVNVLEAAVRRWPTQWYTFYDFWPETAPASDTRQVRREEAL
jgi:KDO2-lipid IV(A) lauroyltransferase